MLRPAIARQAACVEHRAGSDQVTSRPLAVLYERPLPGRLLLNFFRTVMGFALAAILGLSFMAVQFLLPPLLLTFSGRMSFGRRLAWCVPAWVLLGVLVSIAHRRDAPTALISASLWLLYLARLISDHRARAHAVKSLRLTVQIALIGVFIAAEAVIAVVGWWESRPTPMLPSDIEWPLGGKDSGHVRLHLPAGYGFGQYEPSAPQTVRGNVIWPSLAPIDVRDPAFDGFADAVIRIAVSARAVSIADATQPLSADVACRFETDATRPGVDCRGHSGQSDSGEWHEQPAPGQHDLSLRVHPPTYLPGSPDLYDVWYVASAERTPGIIIQCPKETGMSEHGPCIHVFALDALNATVELRYNRLHFADWQQIQARVTEKLMSMRR